MTFTVYKPSVYDIHCCLGVYRTQHHYLGGFGYFIVWLILECGDHVHYVLDVSIDVKKVMTLKWFISRYWSFICQCTKHLHMIFIVV